LTLSHLSATLSLSLPAACLSTELPEDWAETSLTGSYPPIFVPLLSQFPHSCYNVVMKTLLDGEAGRFWGQVAIGPASECWEWEGVIDERGVGRFAVGGKALRAHRVAYSLHFNRDVPSILVVVQTCANLRCCNPDHLVLVVKPEPVAICWEEK
jgi:hypothetical protein